jgi:hypothetical protein
MEIDIEPTVLTARHARACPGHPRLLLPPRRKVVDGRDIPREDALLPGHDEKKPQPFLPIEGCPTATLPDANGEGAAPPFLMFLSAFGFFFSLLLRI